MVYQWYPGHMSKAKREMLEDLKVVDAVIEILDARIPYSSKNPDIGRMAKGKGSIIVLNKSDLADPNVTALWKKYYEEQGSLCMCADSKSGAGIKAVTGLIEKACADKREKDMKKGILNRPLRAMIAGIPNSGKSTFINAIAGKACVKTGNKPGVTKGKQWIRLNKSVELLDTPGILWPKFEDQKVGMRIAFIGSINDEILYPEELSYELLKCVRKDYPGAINKRYGTSESGELVIDIEGISDVNEMIDEIARRRGCLKKGAETNRERAAQIIIDDFRSQKLGKISLERPGRMVENA